MNIAELEKMTVLELRKLAKEKKVKLGAGIDKAGIVKKIFEAEPQADPQPVPLKEESASMSFDVTSAPVSRFSSQNPARDTERPAFRPAWQNRQDPPARSGFRPNPVNTPPKRFGPQAQPVQPFTPAQKEEAKSAEPSREPVKTSDGFRLGYRASAPAPRYQKERREQEWSRPDAGADFRARQRSLPLQSAEISFHDDLFRMDRNANFDRQAAEGELPDLMKYDGGKKVSGILEVNPKGYGFLRGQQLSSATADPYVSPAQIRRFALRPGDEVEGNCAAIRPEDPYPVLLYVDKVNGNSVDAAEKRPSFETLTPVYPDKRIPLEVPGGSSCVRLLDFLAPIGFGQRGMIIAPPESGALTLLRDIANAVSQSDPSAKILMLLIDDTPEEVTELRESTSAEIYSATFAESAETQIRVSETMTEIAMRYAEEGKNAVILLDSLNKLTRAYMSAQSQGMRPITNAVTPAALARPKRLFGMARNLREGGSLSVFATMQTGTGSRIDEIIYEEFRGTANAVLTLSPFYPDDPIFPMVDLQKSGTRKEDLLLSETEAACLMTVRKMLGNVENREAVSQLMSMMQKTRSNEDLLAKLKEWFSILEKK